MVGMISDNLLLYNSKLNKLVSNPISDGIGPLKRLKDKSTDVNSERNPISEGIGPFKLFPDKSKNFNLVSKPISEGSDPVNALKDKSSNVKLVSKPISLGMVPVRPEKSTKKDDRSEGVKLDNDEPTKDVI